MEKITSFTIDHTKSQPRVYVSEKNLQVMKQSFSKNCKVLIVFIVEGYFIQKEQP